MTLLPAPTIRRLQRGGQQFARAEKRLSRLQFFFARLAIREWWLLPEEARDEIRLLDFYAECSQYINEGAGYVIVSASGETLRRWCDVAGHYDGLSGMAEMESIFSFDYFDKARRIGTDPTNALTSLEALNLAYDNGWSSDEMYDALKTKKETNPAILENRKRFPDWVGRFADPLIAMNGNKQQAEYHLSEYVRLVETDRK